MKPKVSIIILHYQDKKVLFNCLLSLKKNKPKISHEIIVVDNDEQPIINPKTFKKKFPLVKYIKSPGNIGYGAGNNLGVKNAQAEYLFIVNPDTEILKGSIDNLVQFIKNKKKTAAVAPLLIDKNKNPYPLQGTAELTPLRAIFALSFINRLFPNNPISNSYWLQAQNLKQPKKVEAIPGSAFLIRKKIFKQVGQFDENMFLYFEESDLGKRLKKAGFNLYIFPQAKVIHHWAGVTPNSPKIIKYFQQSRFYYFKKHFNLFSALAVEFFTRISFKIILLSLLVLLATWLRFFRLSELMVFIGDQGRDYLAARDMLLTSKLPLVGIPSSVPWLKQGPFFIWLIALALKIGDFNPIAPAVLTSTLGVLTVYLTYKFSRFWFKKTAAFVTALIMTTSPLVVIHSRMPYHTSPIPLFSLLFIFSVYHWSKKNINIFWPIILWAVLLQFELTTLPLILLIPLIFYFQKIKPIRKHIFTLVIATIIPFIPKIIYDFTHGFKQTLGFIAWGIYRFLSFFGFKGEHTVSLDSFKIVTLTIFDYWKKFISWDNPLIAIIIALAIIVTIIYRLQQKKLTLNLKILFSFILINFIAFYFHQGPSEAYFPVLFPAWALLIGWLVNHFKKPVISLLFILLSFYNIYYLVNHDFIPYGPTLEQRLTVVRLIKSQTQNQPFKLKNHHSVEQYHSFLDSYRYLLWWFNRPEDKNAQTIYTIYEGGNENFIPPRGATIYHFDKLKLIKYD